MAIFPDLSGGNDTIYHGVAALVPLNYSTQHRVLATEFENGSESRRKIWSHQRRPVTVNYKLNYALDETGAEDLTLIERRWREFYNTVEGPLRPFVMYFPIASWYDKEFCGVLTTTTTTINLPSKDAVLGSFIMYRNGSYVNVGDYTFAASTGNPNKEDQAIFNYSLSPGDVFHWSFKGRLKIWGRLGDNMTHIFQPTLYNEFSVDIIPLRNVVTGEPL
jgi:hypothetical protein